MLRVGPLFSLVSALALQSPAKPAAPTPAPRAIAGPEIRIDFYTRTAPDADVEVEVHVFGVPKPEGASTDAPKPRHFTRAGTWRAGGVDVAELAKLVADAIASGGFDTTQDGARVVFRGVTEVTVRASSWSAIGAQVSAVVPGDKPRPLSLLLDLGTTKPAAAVTVSASARGTGPIAPSSDPDPPAAAPPPKPDPKGKGAPKKPEPAKPEPKKPEPAKPDPKKPEPAKPDPKAASDPKRKPASKTEIPVGVASGAEAAAARDAVVKAATDAGWKLEAKGDRAIAVVGAPEGGAPKWAAIRVHCEAGAKFGVEIGG